MAVPDMVDLQRHDPIEADEVVLRVDTDGDERKAGGLRAWGHDAVPSENGLAICTAVKTRRVASGQA
ncbi:MAG: hypothetical protein ACRYG4_23875 [Janthinobacterium lividum]